MDATLCEVCHARDFRWMDDDGVLRCNSCHNTVAMAWGGDYDVLIARRTTYGIHLVEFAPDDEEQK